MSVIVHYIKHWDNDTKGTIQTKHNDLISALIAAQSTLYSDAMEDSVDPEADAASLYTITKAEIGPARHWTGLPKAAF